MNNDLLRELFARDSLAQRRLGGKTGTVSANLNAPAPLCATEQAFISLPLATDIRQDVRAGLQWLLDKLGASVVVAIDPDTRSVAGHWLDFASFDQAEVWTSKKNQSGSNIYFTANLPVQGLSKKSSKNDIHSLRAVFADVDAKSGRSLNEVFTAIKAISALVPSAIIATGGGLQPVWLLDRHLPATAENMERVEVLGRRIAQLVGGDAVQNVDRILRLPFTTNYPNARKRADGRGISCSGLVCAGAD